MEDVEIGGFCYFIVQVSGLDLELKNKNLSCGVFFYDS